jgi:large subunit ribosomal protein L10
VNRDQKAAVVDEVAADIKSADAVFAVDYRGMSVTQAAELRGKLIDAQASLRVVKNTLTQRAADKAGNDNLKTLLEGPTALTFVNGDVAVAAKVIADFRRTNELPQFKGGSMGGDALTAEQLDAIAKLPARDILNAQLAGTIASPLTGLVRGLNALISGIAVALGQIAEQGLVGGDSPPPVDSGQSTVDSGEAPGEEPAPDAETPAEEAAEAAEGTPAEPQATPDEQPPEPEAAAAEAPAEETPAEEAPAEETPSEAPGDPVAEAEAAEEETSEETPSEGDKEQEG